MRSGEVIQTVAVETDDDLCRAIFADGLGDTEVSGIQSQVVLRDTGPSTATEETYVFDGFTYFQTDVN